MTYGCIGERLGHSFSREIHEKIGRYAYELCEVPRDGLDAFLDRRDFRAINVTIPYKQAVIPHLAEISDTARAIGAVNTIVNDGGRLIGYNTDFGGMNALLDRLGFSLAGKKVLILGTGGTSKTAYAVAKARNASEIYRVSRSEKEGALSYEAVLRHHTDAAFILNTTPVGMFPHPDEAPIALDAFSALEGVLDAVYNPLETRLVRSAREKGIPAEGGLYMLVAQAVLAAGIFLDTPLPPEKCEQIYHEIAAEKKGGQTV